MVINVVIKYGSCLISHMSNGELGMFWIIPVQM